MENKNTLIGQLRVMAAMAPHATIARYINQAANAICRNEIAESDSEEVIAALDLMIEECRSREAGILRGAVLELEKIVEDQREGIVYLPLIHVG